MSPMKEVFVVIPAYNEESRLPSVIGAVKEFIPLGHIIVADDGSRRPIAGFLPQSVRIARHAVNLGKGMALKTGCELAIKLGAKTIILMDADGQHDPAEIPKFLKLLKKNDIVFGTRYIGEGMPFWRLLGNRLLNKACAWLYSLKLNDIWCGYRAFKTGIYSKIKWNAADYSVDVEMAIKVGQNKIKHQELFVGTIYHDKGSYTGTSAVDGIKLLLELFIWKFTLK